MRRISGIAAADGIAFGQTFIADRRRIKIPRHHIAEGDVESEIERFDRALEATDRQFQRIKEKLYRSDGQEHTLILAAHQLILKDEQLVERTRGFVRKELINAEWALRQTISGIKKLFDEVEDDYFRERRTDVDFVANHLMATLTGARQIEADPPADSIVVAYDLSPADTARLFRVGINAIITEVGGRTSHTSIIARSLGIPTVVGVKGLTEIVGTGDPLIVDGYRGEVIHFPDEEANRRYQRRIKRRARISNDLHRERDLSAETLDGVGIQLLANIELSDEIPMALAQGAEGIGLYRTEFLYLGRERMPSQGDHRADATTVLELSQGCPVTFRTCDLGADKIPDGFTVGREMNPSMGLRSIRLCLEQQEMFRDQLTGLLEAASGSQVQIMFPMISGVEEFRQAKEIYTECLEALRRRGAEIPEIPVGVMIEMPSAAITADILAREADFLSIGTNDLTQYSLAVDRVNEHVNYLFQPYHPAILRLISQVVAAGKKAAIPVTVCGEMAGDPLMTLVLIGLGVRKLSMSPVAVPLVKRVIRGAPLSTARDVARRVLEFSTPFEIEEELQDLMGELYPDLKLPGCNDLDDETQA